MPQRLSLATLEKVKAALSQGIRRDEIAAKYKTSTKTIGRIASGTHPLQLNGSDGDGGEVVNEQIEVAHRKYEKTAKLQRERDYYKHRAVKLERALVEALLKNVVDDAMDSL